MMKVMADSGGLLMAMFARLLVAGTACLIVGAAHAADAPTAVEPVAAEEYSWIGAMEVGGLGRYAAEYDGDGDLDYDDLVGGAYASFSAWGGSEALMFGVDGYLEAVVLEGASANDDLTPAYVGALGAHVGAALDNGYFGAFGAVGVYPDDDVEDVLAGYAIGIEGTVDAGDATVFGKLGYALAGSDEYNGDDELEGMVGPFIEAGALYAVSDELAIMLSAGLGYSANFDNTDDPGGYAVWGAKLAYALPTDTPLNMTAAYEGFYSMTQLDNDDAFEHSVKVGLSVPFGNESAAGSLNPLATSVAPFRGGYASDAL
jgi:hypothetical protein